MNISNFKKTEYNTPFITQRADPYVYRHTDGTYYFTASVPAYDGIVLRKSDTIDGLATAEEKEIWHKHETGIMSQHIWAPELHYLRGNWYIYYAGSRVDDIWALRPYVLKCDGQDPINDSWTEMGTPKPCEEFSFQDFSLDMTVFENKGELYCIWAEKVSVGKKISNLYIARMSDPCTLSTEQVLLTTPDYDWERVDFWVNEGPAVLTHNGKLFVTFSASSTGVCYCMGLLSIDEDANLLDPKLWKKERFPVLSTDWEKGMLGPGHNSFVKAEDGVTDVCVFHARQYDEIEGDPLYDPNRHAYKMKVEWSEDNKPIFDYVNRI